MFDINKNNIFHHAVHIHYCIVLMLSGHKASEKVTHISLSTEHAYE